MNLRRFVGIVVLGLVGACGGNAAESAPPASPGAAGHTEEHGKKLEGPVKPIGEAKVGDKSLCPVSGEEFVVEASSPKVEHGGKTYYFCCPGCEKKFEANPSKYLTKS